jgi:hypothetical protein
MIKDDLIAWTKKYLILDSIDFKVEEMKIKGINPIRLISNPIQPIIQESAEIVIILPIINGIRKIWWFNFIKIIIRKISISGLWAQ